MFDWVAVRFDTSELLKIHPIKQKLQAMNNNNVDTFAGHYKHNVSYSHA